MDTDTQWKLDLLDALSFESIFCAAQLRLPSPEERKLVKPTVAESVHAVANIRAWRSYLPEACVSTMISDGVAVVYLGAVVSQRSTDQEKRRRRKLARVDAQNVLIAKRLCYPRVRQMRTFAHYTTTWPVCAIGITSALLWSGPSPASEPQVGHRDVATRARLLGYSGNRLSKHLLT
jgi:hypothetical protein